MARPPGAARTTTPPEASTSVNPAAADSRRGTDCCSGWGTATIIAIGRAPAPGAIGAAHSMPTSTAKKHRAAPTETSYPTPETRRVRYDKRGRRPACYIVALPSSAAYKRGSSRVLQMLPGPPTGRSSRRCQISHTLEPSRTSPTRVRIQTKDQEASLGMVSAVVDALVHDGLPDARRSPREGISYAEVDRAAVGGCQVDMSTWKAYSSVPPPSPTVHDVPASSSRPPPRRHYNAAPRPRRAHHLGSG